jgi:hypothetical protein
MDLVHRACLQVLREINLAPIQEPNRPEPLAIERLRDMVMDYYATTAGVDMLESHPTLLQAHIELLRSLTTREENPEPLTMDLVHRACLQVLRAITLEPILAPRPLFEFNRAELLALIGMLILWLVVPPQPSGTETS